jgi:hypothetical protein
MIQIVVRNEIRQSMLEYGYCKLLGIYFAKEKQLRIQLFMAEMLCNNTKNIQSQVFL